MRAKTRLRKAALEAELNSLRQKMASEILNANKSGGMEKCEEGKIHVETRESYCNAHFIEDFVRNGDCKTDENFCYMCCESEFGSAVIDRRDSCYNMCDLNVPKVTPQKKTGDGPWLWTPKTK